MSLLAQHVLLVVLLVYTLFVLWFASWFVRPKK